MSVRVSKVTAIAIGAVVLVAMDIARLEPSTELFEANPIDHAWEISLAATLAQGQLSGRDFYFTYGPLAQLVAYTGASWNDGSLLDGFFTLQLAFQLLAVFLLCLALALVKRIGWRGVILAFFTFAMLDVLHDVAAPRMLALVVGVLVAHRALEASTPRRRLALACTAGAASFFAQLLTPEIGLVALVVNVLTLCAFAVFARIPRVSGHGGLLRPHDYARAAALVLGVHVLGNVALCAWYAATSDAAPMDYLRYTAEQLRGYNATMGLPWQPPLPVSAAICGTLAYVTWFVIRRLRRVRAHDAWLLLSLWCAAIAAARSMLLRSDWAHVSVAAIPALFLLVLASLDWDGRGRRRFEWAVVVAVLLATWPDASNAARAVARVLRSDVSLGERLAELRTFRMLLDDVVPRDLGAHVPESEHALVMFPYENDIAVALGRPLLAPTLQAFLAHTPALQHEYTAELERNRDGADVAYAVDDVASWRIDGVQTITRLPFIFEYLQRNYDLPAASVAASGFYLLRRRAEPAVTHSTALKYSTVRNGRASLTFRLDEPAFCSLLKLGVRIDYPPSAWLARPERLDVRVMSGDIEIARTGVVPVVIGEAFDTYVSLMDPPRFHEVFVQGGTQVKSIDGLRVAPASTGVLGVQPSATDVTHVDCVTFE
jgi:hypothetical protein